MNFGGKSIEKSRPGCRKTRKAFLAYFIELEKPPPYDILKKFNARG
jgi:hypothetical protein